MTKPSYLKLYGEGKLDERIGRALKRMEKCHLCPRRCGVNRLGDERGYCKTGRKARIASYNAHFGEEAPLVGSSGSGTIFFSSCNLLCSFCQNYEISHFAEGVEVESEQLAAIMLRLQKKGCHNINYVTPTHVVPQILEGLAIAVEKGLALPLVYNTGGYDSVETLKILDGIVDIYMPDFKFWDETRSERFCGTPDYRERAEEAIREMHRQVGDLEIDEKGIAVKGLLVRHLVMPNDVADTGEVMKFLANEISPNTYVNIMDQYRPCYRGKDDAMINRPITPSEFQNALDLAKKAGLERLDNRVRFPRHFLSR
ncbi:MAG: radical SAM protein [Deltaproteobacteria bacterium]|nr:radical SAM protein [Deltaproteobacteria bacterium]